MTEDKVDNPFKKHKKIVIGIIVALCTILVIYFGMAVYFMSHFLIGSEINGFSVSGKNVKEVNELMAAKLQTYTLNLKERGDKNEQIKGEEAGLKYNSEGEFKNFKDKQNPFKWVAALFSAEGLKMTEGVKYDEKLLKELVDKLSCFESSNIIEPKNAGFKYADNNYVIIGEVAGNKVDKEILYKHISEALLNRKAEVDFEAIDCYVKPQYTSKSSKIIETRNILNKYVSSKITYSFGANKEVLDGSSINKWLAVDEKFTVTLDEGKVKDYIETLAKTYNTTGKTRSIVTTSGRAVNVGGGDYGWSINKAKETQDLITSIKEGQTAEKEPAYTQSASSHGNNDIGNTYVEIDLTKQHLWFYKNGSLIVQGDVVTGNVSAGHTTPPGIYRLKYKQKDAVLRGPGYAAPVTFWMPFNGGIGIHDASWRNKFGGTIYKTDGSHGCVNSPFNLAKTIFENIQPGTPVVCYY